MFSLIFSPPKSKSRRSKLCKFLYWWQVYIMSHASSTPLFPLRVFLPGQTKLNNKTVYPTYPVSSVVFLDTLLFKKVSLLRYSDCSQHHLTEHQGLLVWTHKVHYQEGLQQPQPRSQGYIFHPRVTPTLQGTPHAELYFWDASISDSFFDPHDRRTTLSSLQVGSKKPPITHSFAISGCSSLTSTLSEKKSFLSWPLWASSWRKVSKPFFINCNYSVLLLH